MKAQEFEAIKANVSEFKGRQVKWERYYPSAEKTVTEIGVFEKVGDGVNKECIIISQRGKRFANHYSHVEMI